MRNRVMDRILRTLPARVDFAWAGLFVVASTAVTPRSRAGVAAYLVNATCGHNFTDATHELWARTDLPIASLSSHYQPPLAGG